MMTLKKLLIENGYSGKFRLVKVSSFDSSDQRYGRKVR